MTILLVVRLVVVALGALLTTGAALLLLGAFAPRIPHLGPFGSLVLSLTGPWLVVVSLVGVALILAASPDRGSVAVFFSALGVIAALAGSFANIQMLSAVRSAGVNARLVSAFNLSAVVGAGPVDATEQYALDGEMPLTLQIYRPPDGSKRAPVLVYIHGGGWVSQDNTIRASDMRWFADRGWLVVSVGYALSSTERHLWNDVIGQLGCALVWVGRNSERFGGDASRISLIGDSAGGNLVINAGYLANQGSLPSACEGDVPRVGAVSAMYPGVDLVGIFDNPDLNRAGATFTTAYTGGSPAEFPDRYRAVSSASHIHAEAPPTFVVVGENDHLVPPQGAYNFVERARAAGVDVQLVRFPYGQHGFDLFEGSLGNQIFREGTYEFLKAHGQTPAAHA